MRCIWIASLILRIVHISYDQYDNIGLQTINLVQHMVKKTVCKCKLSNKKFSNEFDIVKQMMAHYEKYVFQ